MMGFVKTIRNRIFRWYALSLLPSCQTVTDRISLAMDQDTLTWRDRIELKLHLRICVWCERYLKHLRFMREAVRKYSNRQMEDSFEEPSLSSEAKERLKSALKNKD